MSRTSIVAIFTLAAALAIGGAMLLSPQDAQGGGGANIVVDTNLNNDIADGLCSLREAITAANTNLPYQGCIAGTGRDLITFILGAQPRTINIVTKLPAITAPVVIDGGDPKVELRGPGGTIVSDENGLAITAAAPNTEIRNLVINSFRDDGILSSGANVKLIGNYIGTDPTGMIPMPNDGFGIQIHGDGATIGEFKGNVTECNSKCNLISGNAKDGILLDLDATNAQVTGNFIGTDITGAAPIADLIFNNGISVKGDFNIIGTGLQALPGNGCVQGCNVISGNAIGILVFDGADTTSIGANFIGTDPTGTAAVTPGFNTGVRNLGHHTFVGGDPSVPGNLISGMAIGIFAEADLLFVERNLIGTNFDGDQAIPNASYGIYVGGGQTTIIQNSNTISGNSVGVRINNSSGVNVRGNRIGLGALNPTPLGNDSAGVLITGASTMNSIGEVGNENQIAFNGTDGVTVSGPTAIGNIIGANNIYNNAGLGIENISGGNAELTPPAITSASATGASGTACAACQVQVFSDDADEGKIYQGQTTADVSGDWTFTGALVGRNVTATAMDNTLFNTSEFSAPFVIFPRIQGDIDCNDDVEVDDWFLLLDFAVDLDSDYIPEECPGIGDYEVISGFQWGDLNCDGFLDFKDVLYAVAYNAGIALPQQPGCTAIGSPIT